MGRGGGGGLGLSGAPDLAPFGGFMVSPIHCVYIAGFAGFGTTCMLADLWLRFVCLDWSGCFVLDLFYYHHVDFYHFSFD